LQTLQQRDSCSFVAAANLLEHLDLDHREHDPEDGHADRDPGEGISGPRAKWTGAAGAATKSTDEPTASAPLNEDQEDEEDARQQDNQVQQASPKSGE
jgi:hypothetical protein